jgi:hypothetical protein
VFNGAGGAGLPPPYKTAGPEDSYTHDIGFSGVLRKDQSGNSLGLISNPDPVPIPIPNPSPNPDQVGA